MDERNLERIDRYLRKEMTPEESLNFEQEALNDAELLGEVDLTYRVKRSLTDRQQKLYVTGKWGNRRRNRIIRFSSITSVAAMLLIGLYIWHPLSNVQKQETLLAVVESSPIKDEQTKHEQVIRTVRESMEEGQEENAIATIEQLERKREIPTLDDVSRGRFVTNNLLSEEKSDTLAWYGDAYELHWLKICALVKVGKRDDAKKQLSTFVQIEGKYKQKADSLLRVLNR